MPHGLDSKRSSSWLAGAIILNNVARPRTLGGYELEHVNLTRDASALKARSLISGLAAGLFLTLSPGCTGAISAEVPVGEPKTSVPASPPESFNVPDSDFPYELHEIAGKLDLPWSIAFLPDGRMLVTERPGRLRMIDGNNMLSVQGVPEVLTGSHAGLLDVLVDKDFPKTHLLFVTYMHGTPEASTMRVVRARLDGVDLLDKQVIFESRPALSGLEMIGGRLAFGPDGLIYLTLGEHMQMEHAQDLTNDGGKIVRFRPDGSIPDDNPFVGRSDALPEIFSYGHRNPQGLISNAGDGLIWSLEHGPSGGDELNVITRGGNYGWPLVTFGINYDGTIISDKTSAPGLIDSIYHWVPSVAPSSLVAYSGNVMPEDWQGNFLIGALAGESLIRLQLKDGAVIKEERFLHHTIGRIRDVAVSADGYIYLLTDGTEASLYRLEPQSDQLATKPQ
jgi:glucose/arabinose dehydrogenase